MVFARINVFSILNIFMESRFLLKYLKIQLDTDLKIILLIYQNNYVRLSN